MLFQFQVLKSLLDFTEIQIFDLLKYHNEVF